MIFLPLWGSTSLTYLLSIRLTFYQHLNSYIAYSGSPLEGSYCTYHRTLFSVCFDQSLATSLKCCCCCCCSAYLSSCHRTASDANLLDDPHTFHYQDYFVIGGIRTCLGVSDDPMFLWISSISGPLNLLLV